MLGPVEQSLLDAVAQDEQARAERMARAWRFYHGDHPASLATRSAEQSDNQVVNLSRLVVDAGVDALYGQEPEWATGDDTLDAAVAAWTRRRRTGTGQSAPFLATLRRFALNGAVTGHAWRKWSTGDMRLGLPPRLRVLDPANVTAFWDEDDHETVYAYKVAWSTIDTKGRPVERRQMIERATDASWTIRDEQREAGRRWQQIGPTITWPYAWPPISGCQNLPCPNEYWGIADLERDHLDLQEGINYSASNIAKIIRLYAHPRDVGYGFTAGELHAAPGEMILIANERAKIETLPMASDLSSSLDFFATLREAMHATSRTPEVAVGKLQDVGAMSGVALGILWGPLVRKTEAKRLTYGPNVEDAIAEYLVLTGHAADVAQVEVETTWPEIVPSDPVAERQAALMDEQLGASRRTILAMLGYDPDVEAEQKAEEDAAAVALAQQRFDAGGGADPATRTPPPDPQV